MVDDSSKDEKLEKVLKFMRQQIKETNIPWVSWKTLKDNAEAILGESKHPDVWHAMENATYTLVESEKTPRAKDPKIYEYKVGASWIYIPKEMIDNYCGSK